MLNDPISAYMKRHHLTQYDLAFKMKVRPATISDWIHGRHKISKKHAKKLEKISKGEITLEDLGW